MKPILDIAGQELTIGDRIACAFSYGSHGAELRLGTIVDLVWTRSSEYSDGQKLMLEVEWEQGDKPYQPKKSKIRADVVKFAKIGVLP